MKVILELEKVAEAEESDEIRDFLQSGNYEGEVITKYKGLVISRRMIKNKNATSLNTITTKLKLDTRGKQE